MSLQQRAGHGARRLGRPVGAVGAIAQALIAQAQQPGTVRELAARAQVSFGAAAYTCSRLRAAGQLVPVSDARPARLLAAAALPAAPTNAPAWAQMLQRWSSRGAPALVSAAQHDFAAL